MEAMWGKPTDSVLVMQEVSGAEHKMTARFQYAGELPNRAHRMGEVFHHPIEIDSIEAAGAKGQGFRGPAHAVSQVRIGGYRRIGIQSDHTLNIAIEMQVANARPGPEIQNAHVGSKVGAHQVRESGSAVNPDGSARVVESVSDRVGRTHVRRSQELHEPETNRDDPASPKSSIAGRVGVVVVRSPNPIGKIVERLAFAIQG